MHAALLANTAWLDDELTTFQQLTVGLIDEQVTLTRIVPAAVGSAGGLSDSPILGRKITWPESRYATLDHRRLVRLADQLDADGVDVLHALHRNLWHPAAVIGDQLDLPVVYQASAAEDVDQAARLLKQINPTRSVFAVTTAPLAAELRQRLDNLVRVETILPGVHVRDPALNQRTPGEAPCVAVCGDGVMDEAYQTFMEGLRLVIDDRPDVQFFFDGQRTDQHQVWKAARKLELLSNLSFVPRRLGHRQMLLMADGIVHPQALHRSRGVTLLAMAHAMPVLSLADPYLDYLVADHTAWLLEEGTADGWAELLMRLVLDPDAAADLGLRARAWVHDERVASDQIERVLNLYRSVTGEPIAFPG